MNTYANVFVAKCDERNENGECKMRMKELRQTLIGKTISHYDGWNGSSDQFRIGYVKKGGIGVWVFATKGRGFGVYIPHGIIPKLVETGKAERRNEVEGCAYRITWALREEVC